MENTNGVTSSELHENSLPEASVAPLAVQAPASEAPAVAATKKPAPRGMSMTETAMVAILVSALSIFCYDHFYAPKFVVADLEGLSMNLSRAVAEKYITQEQGLARIDQAKAAVEAAGKRTPVLLGSVILGDKSKYKSIELPFVPLPAELKIPETPGATPAAVQVGVGAKKQ